VRKSRAAKNVKTRNSGISKLNPVYIVEDYIFTIRQQLSLILEFILSRMARFFLTNEPILLVKMLFSI